MPNEQILHEVLRRFARTMANPYDVSVVLDELCRSAGTILRSSSAGVALIDDHDRLRFATASDATSRAVERTQEESQTGPCRAAIASGRPVVIDDLRACTDWPDYRTALARIGVAAVLSVPMVLDGCRVGALGVYSTQPRAWTSPEVHAAETLADVAAAYVLNATELHRAQRAAAQLQAALDSRVVIEQAKGRLAAELDVSVDEAFELLRGFARRHQRRLQDVACAVAEAGSRALG